MVSVDLSKRETLIAPYIATTTGQWDGDDGRYTSFLIAVGTPPQSFRVFPATIDPVLTVPIPPGCQGALAAWTECGDSRGVDTYNGQSSLGFVYSGSGKSTTFDQLGIYNLFQYQNEYTTETGLFFQDTVTMTGKQGSRSIQLNNTVVGGQSSFPFWLGSIGLGSTTGNYGNGQLIAPSFLSALKNQSVIQSMSYAYTAGQYNNNIPGSLILGGYDPSRQSTQNVVTPVDTSNGAAKLNIQVGGIYTSGGSDGAVAASVLDSSITASIDSSLSHMWLPESACAKIANAFGLTYDATTALYLVNDTQHATLKSNNATLQFSLGGDKSSGRTNVYLYYNDLDMQAGLPIYSNSTNYFPMKRASNSTQYTLGRVLLQQSYLVVDWERRNFTIGPVLPPSSSSTEALAINTPSASTSSTPVATSAVPDNSGSSSGGIGGGAIAGIIIGVLAIAAIAFGIFFWRRRQQKKRRQDSMRYSQPPPAYDTGAEFYGGDKPEEETAEVKAPATHLSELYDPSQPRHELTSDNVRKLEEIVQDRELMSTPVAELHGDVAGSELDVTSTRTRDSVGSAGRSTVRSSIASPTRTSVLGPDRARIDPVFEME